MLLPLMHDRIRSALAGTSDVLNALLRPLAPGDPRWDLRHHPERFTLREIVAHLADYDAIFLRRLARTRAEASPVLTPVDPAALAAENDYVHTNPAESLARFRERRDALVAFLNDLSQDDWQRPGQMAGQPLTLEEQAAFVCVHDGYHTGQVAQWLAAGRGPDRADSR